MRSRRDIAAAGAGLVAGGALIAKALRGLRYADMKGRVVLVTGGSRGLGLEMAREFGRLGARLILVARDRPELERAQTDLQSRGIAVAIDVADVGAGSEAERMVSDAIAKYGRLDVLVNNAGVMTVGLYDHVSVADFDEAMAVHFWGPYNAMSAAIPQMRRQGSGRIVNISSIGGRIGVPHLVPYCASKFALTGLSTALRSELARQGILITTVCPGLMRTGSPFNAWFRGRHRQEFAWFAIADSVPVISIDSRRAAAQIVDAVCHGDPELIVTWPAKLAIAAAAVFPNVTARALALTNRALPSGTGRDGDRAHSGWQSSSRWAPSPLTRLSERSAAENNELPSSDRT